MDAPMWTMWLAGGVILLGGVAFGYFVWGPPGGVGPVDRRAGSVLLPKRVIDFSYWAIEPVVRGAAYLGIRPNHVTLASVAVAFLAAWALTQQAWWLGLLLFGVASAADMLDGYLARRLSLDSGQAGAFLDSFADRVTDSLFLGGIALSGASSAATWLAVWALVASLLISYARARGEGLGVDCKVGLMQRPERLAWLSLTIAAVGIAGIVGGPSAPAITLNVGLAILAILATVTAVRRALWVIGALSEESHEETTTIPDGARREVEQ
jgi:CDP-diacylglycerol--glycerol-3-phosphate 3-phosphatidyltransferase